MKDSKIKVFYTPNQVNINPNIIGATSRSPLKPMLLMKALDGLGFSQNLDVDSSFLPFSNEDFKMAHTNEYVEAFFKGQRPLCSSNGLPWSKELADSVRYTNASLYNAVRHSYLNPNQVCFSPTSGFHHAHPEHGSGFCTFSGQVIAAVKMYNEFGISGAVLDLDGHYGNSIEDSRGTVTNINKAIPKGFNFAQLSGKNESYYKDLMLALGKIEQAVLENKIQYVMWCHGADSHDQDDLGGQVNTQYWVKCSELFYNWVGQLDEKLVAMGRSPLPVTLSLFGGYRQDSYASVLSLHMKDIQVCINTLCGGSVKYKMAVEEKKGMRGIWADPEKWLNDGTGFMMPISLLRMLEPKKYQTDEEFKNSKMSKNEEKVFEFLKANTGIIFNGLEIGEKVNGWKNHSMSKWANKLVRRGLLQKRKGQKNGFMMSVFTFTKGEPVILLDNFQKERAGLGMPLYNFKPFSDGQKLVYSSYEGSHYSELHGRHINCCRIEGINVTTGPGERSLNIREFLIPETSIQKATH